jgi:hypothetical protein
MKRSSFILLCFSILTQTINAQDNYFNIPINELNGKILRISTTKYKYNHHKTDSLVEDEVIIYKEFDYYTRYYVIDNEDNTVSFKKRIVSVIKDSPAYYNWLSIPIKNFNLFKYIQLNSESEEDIMEPIIFDANENIIGSLFKNNSDWYETYENDGVGTIIEKTYFPGDSTYRTITYFRYDDKKLISEYSIDEGIFNYSYDFFYNLKGDIEVVIHTRSDLRYVVRYQYIYDKKDNWIECSEFHSFTLSEIIENIKRPNYIYKRKIEYY